jgi:hypothetical protein
MFDCNGNNERPAPLSAGMFCFCLSPPLFFALHFPHFSDIHFTDPAFEVGVNITVVRFHFGEVLV